MGVVIISKLYQPVWKFYELERPSVRSSGMAGAFGYQKEHYDISLAIGELKLFPAIREGGADTHVIANGISCRQQIGHGTGRQARHLAEILAEALDE